MCYILKMNIYPANISKHNLNHQNQTIFSMILIGKEWHFLAVKITGTIKKNKAKTCWQFLSFQLSPFV